MSMGIYEGLLQLEREEHQRKLAQLFASTLIEWQSKKRRMGCVAAADWWCNRLPGWKPERLHRYTKSGEYFEHVVITNGTVRFDPSPYNDHPED